MSTAVNTYKFFKKLYKIGDNIDPKSVQFVSTFIATHTLTKKMCKKPSKSDQSSRVGQVHRCVCLDTTGADVNTNIGDSKRSVQALSALSRDTELTTDH